MSSRKVKPTISGGKGNQSPYLKADEPLKTAKASLEGPTTIPEDAVAFLDEKIDPDYEPKQEEIEEFARHLGMKLDEDEDTDLLWIAREGLKAVLPENWRACQMKESGEIYYCNVVTGSSSWDHPCEVYYRHLYRKQRAERTKKKKKTNRHQLKASARPNAATGPKTVKRSKMATTPNTTRAGKPASYVTSPPAPTVAAPAASRQKQKTSLAVRPSRIGQLGYVHSGSTQTQHQRTATAIMQAHEPQKSPTAGEVAISPMSAQFWTPEKLWSKENLEVARYDPTSGNHDVLLIDAEWLVKLDGPAPCRQQLPEDAAFVGSVNDDSVQVLAISYPWLTKGHPDPESWYLAIVQHFLCLLLGLENKGGHESRTSTVLQSSKRVAIFWDWLSLYQEPFLGGRSPEQMDTLERAYQHMAIWFVNPSRMVWRLTKLPPSPCLGHGSSPWQDRGWCVFEKALSELLTPSNRVLDLGLLVEDDGTLWEESDDIQRDGPSSLQQHFIKVIKKTRIKRRQFPVAPEIFNQTLENCSFAFPSDLKYAKLKYEESFREVISKSDSLNFSSSDFSGDSSGLLPTLGACKDRLQILDLSKNVKIDGTLDPLSLCENLKSLDLHSCSGLTASLTPLRNLTKLTKLNFGQCKKLCSELTPLQTLVNLESCSLAGCPNISGYLEPLRSLRKLTQLNLSGCLNLVGSLEPIRHLKQLTALNLASCANLFGSLESLQTLTDLKELNFSNLKDITGDLQALHRLSNLESLNISGLILLAGDLRPVQNLTNLRTANFSRCSNLVGEHQSLETLTKLGNLEELRLGNCRNLRGNLHPVQHLTSLKILDLGGCGNLTGTLQPLTNLTNLQVLNVSRCVHLSGDVNPLHSLVRLKELNLGGAKRLTGDLQAVLDLEVLVAGPYHTSDLIPAYPGSHVGQA